jgi:hypothetical protein
MTDHAKSSGISLRYVHYFPCSLVNFVLFGKSNKKTLLWWLICMKIHSAHETSLYLKLLLLLHLLLELRSIFSS